MPKGKVARIVIFRCEGYRKSLRVAVRDSMNVGKLAEAIVHYTRMEPDHLYYFCDEHEYRIVAHEFLVSDKAIEPAPDIRNTLALASLNKKIEYYLRPILSFIRRNTALETHKIRVSTLLKILGMEFLFIYDMGDTKVVKITVDEVLREENFQKLYSVSKLPAKV